MTPHAELFDRPEPLGRSFWLALILHVTVLGSFAIYSYMGIHGDRFGAQNAGGGAIGIEAVKAIPLAHEGAANPVAHETRSQVPQRPAKAVEQIKKEKISPKAVALKSKEKKRPADTSSEKQKFRPFKELEPNQSFSVQAPQVSSPLYSAMPGSGRIGTGANTTLGNRFAGYGQQIQQLVGQKWRTGDVEARTGPPVVATFELLRDGSIRNLQILQKSGIATLDYSVQRAILEASPFPPIPAGYDRDSAKVEFIFELRR